MIEDDDFYERDTDVDDMIEVDPIICPKCQSTNWRCWDERAEWFEYSDGELYEAPVGYLACKDCGAAFTHHYEASSTHIGDDRDAFGEYD